MPDPLGVFAPMGITPDRPGCLTSYRGVPSPPDHFATEKDSDPSGADSDNSGNELTTSPFPTQKTCSDDRNDRNEESNNRCQRRLPELIHVVSYSNYRNKRSGLVLSGLGPGDIAHTPRVPPLTLFARVRTPRWLDCIRTSLRGQPSVRLPGTGGTGPDAAR